MLRGSDSAIKGVKTDSRQGGDGWKIILLYNDFWPSQVQPYPAKSYSLVFYFSCWPFSGITRAVLLLAWKVRKCMLYSYCKTMPNRWLWLEDFLLIDSSVSKSHSKRWPACATDCHWLPWAYCLCGLCVWLELWEVNKNGFFLLFNSTKVSQPINYIKCWKEKLSTTVE